MVIVSGQAGSGKSSIARRVAWDLHHQGHVIALDVKSPSSITTATWDHLNRLQRLCKRPVLLVIDDVWRYKDFLVDYDSIWRPDICLLATSRPGEAGEGTSSYSFPIDSVELKALDPAVVPDLCDKLAIPLVPISKTIEKLCGSGQILALALYLQNSTFKNLAESILEPLSPESKEIYLDLCVAGVYDLTMPLSVLMRRHSAIGSPWHDRSLEGLVFKAGSNNEQMKVGHALVAKAVLSSASAHVPRRTLEICKACSLRDDEQRRFALKLLYEVALDATHAPAVRAMTEEVEKEVLRQADSAEFSDLYRLALILTKAGASQSADTLIARATHDKMKTSMDAVMLLAQVKKENFNQLFVPLFDFYEKHAAAHGRRRFIALTRLYGDGKQMAALAKLTGEWLQVAKYPVTETCATFDLLNYGPTSDMKEHVHIVENYVNKHGFDDVDAALAAIRVASRFRIDEVQLRVVETIVDAISTGSLKKDITLVSQLARLARRVPHAAQLAAFGVIKTMLSGSGAQSPRLLVSAALIAPPNEFNEVRRLAAALPANRCGRRQRSVEHILASR